LFGLLITIPLHLIYAVVSGRAAAAERAELQAQTEMVRCPECKESVRWDAVKCKHCGAQLTPLSAPPPDPYAADPGAKIIAFTIAGVFAVGLLSYVLTR
jgi:hypothetical protein